MIIALFSSLFLKTSFCFKGGWTVLHRAAFRDSEDIMKILIEHGSNIDLQERVLILILIFFFSFLFVVVLDLMGG